MEKRKKKNDSMKYPCGMSADEYIKRLKEEHQKALDGKDRSIEHLRYLNDKLAIRCNKLTFDVRHLLYAVRTNRRRIAFVYNDLLGVFGKRKYRRYCVTNEVYRSYTDELFRENCISAE